MQQRLNNATTTTQQMQHNYACGTNRATTPFAKVIFDLTDYNPLRLRNNRATAPFAKVTTRLDRLQPPSLDNAYAMTQLNATTTTTSYKHIKSTTKDFYINSKLLER